jgi:hypothetical protein
MGILAISLIIFLSIANLALADGGPHEEVSKVDGYNVKLNFVEGNPQVGQNKLKVEIKDVLDKPVDNSTVTVIAELYKTTAGTSTQGSGHSSGGMDMGEKKDTTTENTSEEILVRTVKADLMPGMEIGKYEGEINLEETGHWMVQVKFLILSRERVAEFPIDIYGAPNSLGILAPFLIINVVIIGVAAITRKKRVGAPALEEAI